MDDSFPPLPPTPPKEPPRNPPLNLSYLDYSDFKPIPKSPAERGRRSVKKDGPPEISTAEIHERDTSDDPVQITAKDQVELQALLAELISRRKSAIALYEPTPEQLGFLQSKSRIRLARGGNRGGKSTTAAIDVGMAITGQHPYLPYPKQGRAIFVGCDLLHASKVMFRKLFKAGQIKIIRDPVTKKWRAFHPDADMAIAHLARDAPPLVPRRFYKYKDISWENKKEEIPRTIHIKLGEIDWECTFFSGEGEPPQGWDVDLVWFDEEIPHAKWLNEMIPRLVDRKGRLIWSATPLAGTVQLYELSSQAEEEKDDECPVVSEHTMNITTNTFISDEDREFFRKKLMADEDEYRVRFLGDFAIHGMRVYSEFSPKVHGHPTFLIPDDWCRYVAIDPGRQVAAALFIAVAPPDSEFSGRGVVYDEIYLKRANALLFAQELKRHVGDDFIRSWIIDNHEGRKVEAGAGLSIEVQYARSMKGVGLDVNGFAGFAYSSDDIDAGILAVRQNLQLVGGSSQFLFFNDKLRMFLWEMERYVYQKINKTGIVTDKPLKRNDHLLDCLRYLAMYQLRWIKPPKKKKKTSYAWEAIKLKKKKAAMQKRHEEGYGGSVILG